jgi:cation diffusion facilitator family transporter
MNAINVMKKSRVINLFLLVFKFIFGVLGNSFALVADAFESLVEAIQDSMCIFAMKHSRKESTIEHPFGKGKSEILSGIMLGLMMIMISLYFIYEAIVKIVENEHAELQLFIIFPALINIAAKVYQYKTKMATNDNLAIDSAAENKLDMLNSVLIITATIIYFIAHSLGSDKFDKIDLFTTIIIALIYFANGLKIMLENIRRNLDARIDAETSQKLVDIVQSVEGVIDVEDLIAEDHGSYVVIYADVHVDDHLTVKDSHDITGKIRTALHKNDFITIRDVIIHVEPYYHVNNFEKKEK